MVANRFAFAALAAACITAAAAGGYLASRPNATTPVASGAPVTPVTPVTDDAPLSAPAAQETTTAALAATPERPVQETEGLVGEFAPAPASKTSPEPAMTKRPDSMPRPAPTARAQNPVPPPATARGPETPPSLDRTWPSSAATPAAPAAAAPVQPPATSAPASAPETTSANTRPDERPFTEEPVEPPQKTFDEIVVSSDSVIGLQTETPISSERARVEDRVEAHVTRDVRVGDRVAIPAGSRALGSVMQVERGGRFKERARLGIRFHTLVLADGTRLPISTETIYREGPAPGNESAAKIGGGAVGGAILGAILGGAKGAAAGASIGAGAGTAAVMAGDRNAATLPPGTPLTVRVLSPVTVTLEKE